MFLGANGSLGGLHRGNDFIILAIRSIILGDWLPLAPTMLLESLQVSRSVVRFATRLNLTKGSGLVHFLNVSRDAGLERKRSGSSTAATPFPNPGTVEIHDQSLQNANRAHPFSLQLPCVYSSIFKFAAGSGRGTGTPQAFGAKDLECFTAQ